MIIIQHLSLFAVALFTNNTKLFTSETMLTFAAHGLQMTCFYQENHKRPAFIL